MRSAVARSQLLELFHNAPLDALFTQEDIAAVLDCSCATLERQRWAGSGIPFIKLGSRAVRYRKGTVLKWLEAHQELRCTSQQA